jgi:hypothetical protein
MQHNFLFFGHPICGKFFHLAEIACWDMTIIWFDSKKEKLTYIEDDICLLFFLFCTVFLCFQLFSWKILAPNKQ